MHCSTNKPFDTEEFPKDSLQYMIRAPSSGAVDHSVSDMLRWIVQRIPSVLVQVFCGCGEPRGIPHVQRLRQLMPEQYYADILLYGHDHMLHWDDGEMSSVTAFNAIMLEAKTVAHNEKLVLVKAAQLRDAEAGMPKIYRDTLAAVATYLMEPGAVLPFSASSIITYKMLVAHR